MHGRRDGARHVGRLVRRVELPIHHPDVNNFFTSLKGQPRDQIRDQVQTYLDANPQVRDDLQAHPATLGRLPPTLWGSGDPLTVSAARFVAQGRSVVGASVDGIACAPTDLVGPKVSALLGWGNPLPVASPRRGRAVSVGSLPSFAPRTEA